MKALRKTSDIVVHELEGELLLYNLVTDKVSCLNRTSAAVWNLCDGTRSKEVISDLLEANGIRGSSPELVELALHQLKSEGLLEDTGAGEPTRFDRRELAKRAGLTALAALPLITSLVAPMPVAAQSTTCGPSAGQFCACSRKVTNFSVPCQSTSCSGACVCSPPFTGCNGGGNQCNGRCA